MTISGPSAGKLLPYEIDTNVEFSLSAPGSGPNLPVRFSPLHEELLSSWLVRLAWANAEKLHTFKRRFWVAPGSPWGRNIDLILPEAAQHKIADMAALHVNKIHDHSLWAYQGKLFEKVGESKVVNGVLVSRRKGKKMLGHGLQLCPQCMSDGDIAYFRRWWKIGYVVACPEHQCVLIDACPICHSPISYHLADSGKALLPLNVPTSFCAICGHKWGSIPDKEIIRNVQREFLDWQAQLITALKTGWFELKNEGLYALSFFNGLRVLLRLIRMEGKYGHIGNTISTELTIPSIEIIKHAGGNNSSGSLRIEQRFYLLRIAHWLMEEWPDRLLWVMKKCGLSFSYIENYREKGPLPYWIASALSYTRDYKHTKISDKEKQSVELFLRNQGMPVNPNQIARWMGRWHVSRTK